VNVSIDVGKYKTLIFDCDGVILNSNEVKTTAFYNATLSYGEKFAQRFIKYHKENGGISRYKKFEYFMTEIVRTQYNENELSDLLDIYAREVSHGLLTCQIADNIDALRKATPDARWLIVSGGDQLELREVFKKRNLDIYFDGGIFGSPENKNEIIAREVKKENVRSPCLFIGDSRYDFLAANQAGLDFVFVSKWTDFEDWYTYVNGAGIDYLLNIEQLLNVPR
jgi:HAD superfamily hydrolase (TIGR01549 family)